MVKLTGNYSFNPLVYGAKLEPNTCICYPKLFKIFPYPFNKRKGSPMENFKMGKSEGLLGSVAQRVWGTKCSWQETWEFQLQMFLITVPTATLVGRVEEGSLG